MSLPPFALRASSAAAVFFLACSAMPTSSRAEAASLSTVVITGSREPLPLNRLVGDVSVIDSDRIRASTADSVEDLLRREGGIQMSRTGGPGQSAGAMLRGSSPSSTVVLIDGVRIGSATLGQTDLSSISLAQIERIEILRGPGSSLYGADAVGGVVHIITRRGQGPADVSAHAAVGGLNSSELDGSVTGSAGAFDYAASLSREASDGVSALKPGDQFGNYNPDRDGFKRSSVQLRGGFTFVPGHRLGVNVVDSRLRAQFDGSEFNPPTYTQDASPDFRNRFDTRVSALDYRGVISPEWSTSVQLSRQIDKVESGGTTVSGYETQRDQLTWQAAWKPAAGHQLVGALERLDENVDVAALGDVPRRRNDAIVLGYSGSFAGHKVQADVRHDHNTAFGNVDTGKLGWGFDVTPAFSLRAVVGTAFRAPSFNDLYYPQYGVSTIRPERSRSIEVGANWHAGDSAAGITIYRNQVRDLIGYEPVAANCPAGYPFGCAANISRARLQGATLTASHHVGAFSLRAAVDFLDARDRDFGDRLRRRAAHQETFGVDWTGGPWTLGATLVDVGARPDGAVTLAAYQTLDLQARYKVTSHCEVEAKLLNASDRQYEPARDYQSPGRQAWIGVRYNSVGL